MSSEPSGSADPYTIDARYGYIQRPNELMRMYLRDNTAIQPDLYYRIVGAEVTMVIGRELIAFAPALERKSLTRRIRSLRASVSAAVVTVYRELCCGLALYGRYWIPIVITDSSI